MNRELLKTEIRLENDRVLLLPFENERNEELREIIFDDNIWKYMGMYVRTDADFTSYISNTIDQKNQGLCYPFIIIDKKTNRVAGSTRFGAINVASEKCEIGWTWYGKDFMGTGLNKACKNVLLQFGFEELGVRRIQLGADADNFRSQRAIEKLGAKKEGVLRNNYIDSEGASRDDVYFSIIREEWKEIKETVFL